MDGALPGQLLIISGPSGTGKTTICERLLETVPGSEWSVSCTTRPRRGEEVHGRDYWFLSPEEFARMRDAGEFLETAQYLGNWYGTPRKPVDAAIAAGRLIILEIDVQGAAQIARAMPGCVRVFILPPSMDALRARLAGRHTEPPEVQARRIAKAAEEIEFARTSGVYREFVTNDTIEGSVQRVLQILAEHPRLV
jgi:guanylate kinase